MLTQMGVVIKDAVREVDVVARYGGDEFVLVLLGADVDTGRTIAERVRERVAAHRFRTETGKEGAKDCEETVQVTVQVTVSIGLAAFPENARTKEQLLRMADETMYSSKRSGKNRVTVYEAVPEADHIQLSGEGNGGQGPDEITV
jgi:diguanylate cyclase (GGDEF)-like protein